MRALCGALVLLVVVCVALGLPSGHHKHNNHHHKDLKHTHAHKGHKQVRKTDHVHSHEEFNYEVNVHTAVDGQHNLHANDEQKGFMEAFLTAVLTRDETVDFVHGTKFLHGGGDPVWKEWILADGNPLKVTFGDDFVTGAGSSADRTEVRLKAPRRTSAKIYGLDNNEQPLKDMKTAIDKLNKAANRVQARPAHDILEAVNQMFSEAQGTATEWDTLEGDITTAEDEIHHKQDATQDDVTKKDEILQRIADFDTRNLALRDAHKANLVKYDTLSEEVDQFSKDIGLVLQLIENHKDATALITEVQGTIAQARADADNLQTAITTAASPHIHAVRRAQTLVNDDKALCNKIEAAINAATASRDMFTDPALNGLTHGCKQKLKDVNNGITDTKTEQDKHNFKDVKARVNELRVGFKKAVNKACEEVEARKKAANQGGGNQGGNQGRGWCPIF